MRSQRARRRLAAALCLLAVVGLLAVVACGAPPATEEAAAPETEYLTPPFTADEIRDEWAPGLTIVFHFSFPDRQEWQRWTVVDADAERAVIEYQPLDEQGRPTGPPERSASGWGELRDHALFPAAGAQRQRITRGTVLGELEGWLYEVGDPATETVNRYFFADRLPGAPVWMETRSGETVLLSLNQIARQRLSAAPPAGPETAPGRD